MNEDEAARKLQGLFRTRKARKYLRELLAGVFQKVQDDDSGDFFYYNTRTGESSWVKPKLLGSGDLSIGNLDCTSDALESQKDIFGKTLGLGTWNERLDKYGQVVYVNDETGEISNDLLLVCSSTVSEKRVSDPGAPVLLNVASSSDLVRDHAARKLQGMFRMRKARVYRRILVSSLYEKIFDDESRLSYYHNKRTGETTWL
jgi:hypothetical protein